MVENRVYKKNGPESIRIFKGQKRKKHQKRVSRNERRLVKDILRALLEFSNTVWVCVNTHGGREGRRGKEEMNVCPQFFYPVMLSSLMYSLHLPQLLLGVQPKEAVAPPVHSMMMMTSVEQLIIHLLDPFVESKF